VLGGLMISYLLMVVGQLGAVALAVVFALTVFF
jgi:hypothetical protein